MVQGVIWIPKRIPKAPNLYCGDIRAVVVVDEMNQIQRTDLARSIAESDIAGCSLENADIDALVDLFESWLERRPTPVLAAPVAADARDLIAWKWAETLSEGEQSVLLNSSIKRLQEAINAALTPVAAEGMRRAIEKG